MTVVAGPEPVYHSDLLSGSSPPAFEGGLASKSRKRVSHSLDNDSVDIGRLRSRASFYAERAGASQSLIDDLESMLSSRTVEILVGIPESELVGELINDAYKPKMHKLYSQFYNGVTVDFCLNVRKSPFALDRMRDEDPELYAEFEQRVKQLHNIKPITARTEEVLRDYFDLDVPAIMRERAETHGVAEVHWEHIGNGAYAAIAHGPIEAASHVETSMTQLVQDYAIRAQVREVQRRMGIHIDRTERIANSLGKCAGLIQHLRSIDNIPKLALFAGRRASDRTFLLLQNLFCAAHLPGYSGTSAIFAVDKIDAALAAQGASLSARKAMIGRLVGTHAHEVMSITAQLMACHDDEAGGSQGPVGLSAVLAHLMVLRANGNLAGATALADTFGTAAFVELALVTKVPPEFIADMRANFPNEAPIPDDAVVFDLIKIWRLDSGTYQQVADVVISGWERRCAEIVKLGRVALPRPALMHSNLSNFEEIAAVCELPERIRPNFCAFGGVADGFLPFDVGGGRSVTLQMASVVMKAIQAHAPGVEQCMECAGKLGDDIKASKAQVDPRLPAGAQERVLQRMKAMAARRDVDAERCSRVLAEMYAAVTRKHVLCET